ncbi:putative sensor histidine protein kinase (plasmid) [Ensifer adhaerens OV14]|nr:putative sensor histidine protein kinase [Ensifer adhaerens OV14]
MSTDALRCPSHAHRAKVRAIGKHAGHYGRVVLTPFGSRGRMSSVQLYKESVMGNKKLVKVAEKVGAMQSAASPKLLSGGNPQIAKGYGDEPVQAYIAAMPGWKSEVGGRIDALIERIVPGVRKGVKWNSPFYGVEDGLWFLSLHCFTKYVKVTFLNGVSLQPLPPGTSKHPKVRYLDIHQDQFDETQFADWVKQASQLPGERM